MTTFLEIPRQLGLKVDDEGKEVRRLQKYLENFGYIQSEKEDRFGIKIDTTRAAKKPKPSIFDNETLKALKVFQEFNKLPITGILDKQTINLMMKPRCALPDLVAGEVVDYVYSGKKWSKQNLKYLFENYTSDLPQNISRRAFGDALAQWSSVTPLSFSEVDSAANIRVSWRTGAHGDGNPFDGSSGILAHAFYPKDGRLHFDDAELWTDDNPPSGIDLASVALHEMGHILGLAHSSDTTAVMYAYYSGRLRELQSDDIAGIQSIYGTHPFSLQYVFYRDVNGDIIQLWQEGATGWHLNNLTTSTGAPKAVGDPCSNIQGSLQYVFYRDVNGDIIQLWHEAATGWHLNNLTTSTGAPKAVGDPCSNIQIRSNFPLVTHLQYVFYRAQNGDIIQLWHEPATSWHLNNLTTSTGAPKAVGDPCSNIQGNLQYVFYRAQNGDIIQLWHEPATSWHLFNLTAALQAPAAVGDPCSNIQGNLQYVFYRAQNGDIIQLWHEPATSWHLNNLTTSTGAPKAVGDPCSNIQIRSNFPLVTHLQYVFYRAQNGDIIQLWHEPATSWHLNNLTTSTGAPKAVGDPCSNIQGSLQYVFYRDVNGDIIQLWHEAATGWHLNNLTANTGAPTASGNPCSNVQ